MNYRVKNIGIAVALAALAAILTSVYVVNYKRHVQNGEDKVPVYVAAKDIPAGTYHTSGGGQCYFATLGSTDTGNILDNNNFNGPETVDVSGAFAFEIQGGCTWVRAG